MFSEDIERDSAIKWVSGRSRNKQINKQTHKQIILLYWTQGQKIVIFKKKSMGIHFGKGAIITLIHFLIFGAF